MRNFQNVLDAINTNKSDFSCADESDEELCPAQDSSCDDDKECADDSSTSEEEDDRETVAASDLKKKYANSRFTRGKTTFDQPPMKFENDFPHPPAEPLTAKQYFYLFVSRTMLKQVVEETNTYYMQKNGTPLGLTVEELTSVFGMFFRMELVNMHRDRAYWETGSR